MAQPAAEAPPPPPFDTLAKNQKKEFLDARLEEIAPAEARATAGRKKLAEQTKAFRVYMSGTPVASDEQLMGHIGTLLKAYQGEVDILTKRARAFEWALGYVTPWIKATLDATSLAPAASPAAPPSDVLSKLHLQIEALNETLEDKEVQAQLLRAERDKATASLQAAEKAHLELAEAAKQEIAAARQKDAEHAKELECLNSTAASLQESLTATIAANKEVVGRNEKLISELDQKCANLTSMVAEAQLREQTATAQANESMAQLKQREEELNSRAKELRLLQDELINIRLNDSQHELAKAAAIEENALLGDQLRATEQELKQLHAVNTSLQSTITELKESMAAQPTQTAQKVELKAPAATDDALLIFEATGGLKDPGAALLAAHPHHSPAPLPHAAVAAATEEEDDAWGWKDDDDKPATAAVVAPTIGSVKAETHMPPPSPVKAAPAPFSAAELQSNMAQLLLKEDATEEELDRLEDLHHEQLRKISRAKWQLLKRQLLGHS